MNSNHPQGDGLGMSLKHPDNIQLLLDTNLALEQQYIDAMLELRKTKQFRSALDKSVIITVHDLEGRFLDANELFCQRASVKKEQVIGQSFHLFETKQSKKVFSRITPQVMAGRPKRYEAKYVSLEGEPFWLDISINPISDESGAVEGFLTASHDITNRKELEETAQQNRLNFSVIHQIIQEKGTPQSRVKSGLEKASHHLGMHLGMMSKVVLDKNILHTIDIFDASKTLRAGSKFSLDQTSALEVYGSGGAVSISHLEDGFMGMKSYIGITLHKDGEPYGVLDFYGGEPQPNRQHFDDADKRFMLLLRQWAENEIKQMKDNERILFQSIELHEANMQLDLALQEVKNAQSKLVHAEKMASLGVLAAGMAHEINNPLNFIHAGVQTIPMLIKEIEQLGIGKENEQFIELLADFQEISGEIRKGTERVAEVVKGFSAFSQMGNTEFQLLDIVQCMEKAKHMSVMKASEKVGIKILAHEEVSKITGSPAELNQAFMNVLDNAIEHTMNSVHIMVEIAPDRLADGRKGISIIVTDNGIGMTEEEVKKAFEPFFTTKDVGEGKGLGLSIAHGIIQRHKGEICIQSRKDMGTSVTMKLPLKQTVSGS